MRTNSEKISELGMQIIAVVNQTSPKTKLYQLRANGLKLTVEEDKKCKKK